MERFCFNNMLPNFSETKKFSTESFLTFREPQHLVSYKRVSYKKKYVYMCRYRLNQHLIVLNLNSVSINKTVVTEFIIVKVSPNLRLM